MYDIVDWVGPLPTTRIITLFVGDQFSLHLGGATPNMNVRFDTCCQEIQVRRCLGHRYLSQINVTVLPEEKWGMGKLRGPMSLT